MKETENNNGTRKDTYKFLLYYNEKEDSMEEKNDEAKPGEIKE